MSENKRQSLEFLKKSLTKSTKLLEKAQRLNLMGEEYKNLVEKKEHYQKLLDDYTPGNDESAEDVMNAQKKWQRKQGEEEEDEEEKEVKMKATAKVKEIEDDNDKKKKDDDDEQQKRKKDEETAAVAAVATAALKPTADQREVIMSKLKKVKKKLKKTKAGSKDYKKYKKRKKECEQLLGIYVEKIPKRSALFAMDTPEREEYIEKMKQEKLNTWFDNNNDDADNDPCWKIETGMSFNGFSSSEALAEETVKVSVSSIEEGIDLFDKNPEKYIAVYYPNEEDQRKTEEVNMTYVLRSGTIRWRPKNLIYDTKGKFIIRQHKYKRLEKFDDDTLPKNAWRDKYTDDMTFNGTKLHDSTAKKKKNRRLPLCPGRGMGLADGANTTLIGRNENIHSPPNPDDVFQGSVGDCWLLSAIACLADYDWAVKRLFRKTLHIEKRPFDDDTDWKFTGDVDFSHDARVNRYIVTLWDLVTWKEYDVIIDERLPIRPNVDRLLGSKPSKDGKLWVPYLEKAIACHCGGYDKLVGGSCINAWPMITGSRNQYVITLNAKTGTYFCNARYSPCEGWVQHSNSPHDSNQSYWNCPWPEIGGGGDLEKGITSKELFYKIVEWDENNYLIGAGTDGSSDTESTEGMVDNHAYSVIDSREDICGTGVDLLLVRNPWGTGDGLKNGQFVRNGAGWKKYPEIKAELKPLEEDTGVFWLTKEEFFSFFPTMYLCAFNMERLKHKDYVNDLDHDMPPPDPNSKVGSTHIIDPEDLQAIHIDTTSSDPSSPYEIVTETFNGGVSVGKVHQETIKGKSIKDAFREFKENPDKYFGINYQTSIVEQGWPDQYHSYIVIYREGTEVDKLKVKDPVQGGGGLRTMHRNVLKK